jgi:hypothetical protein
MIQQQIYGFVRGSQQIITTVISTFFWLKLKYVMPSDAVFIIKCHMFNPNSKYENIDLTIFAFTIRSLTLTALLQSHTCSIIVCPV